MEKPLIGISMDSSKEDTYSSYPWYALREHYCQAVEKAGGLPVMLPHSLDLIDHYLNIVDGIALSGGDFDPDPEMYGEKFCHEKTVLNPIRSAFDFALVKKTLDRNIPFLGICAGQQMLNIVRGGMLIQHIPDQWPDQRPDQRPDEHPEGLNHSQAHRRHKPTHDIILTTGTLLAHCNQDKEKASVNTSHHQAIKKVGQNLVVSAVAPDGIIEAIEDPSLAFCLGVQWHPEFLVSDFDYSIYNKFIEVASHRKESSA